MQSPFNIKPLAVTLALAILAFVPAAPTYSEATEVRVEKIRYRSGPNYTRVVIDLDRKAEFKYHLLKKDPKINKPRRLYIDIVGGRLGPELKRKIPINDGLLKMVRAGQYDESTVRVVLDIETLDDFTVFPLSNPYRVVIDVTGKGSARDKVKKPPPSKTVERAPGVKVPPRTNLAGTIVIDPGHGGKDPGAMGKRKLKEKDLTLKIARLVKKDLSKRLKSSVVLTRDRDVYIPLDERTAIANSKEADLFVSIHVNSSPNRKATGVETYYLGEAKDKEALRVAARENAATPEEMSDIVQYIIRDMESNVNRNESIRLATHIQETLSKDLAKKYSGIKSNGVKEALFYVLVKSNMPSVLVEVSFISNPTDEKRLRTDKYLNVIAKSISAAIIKYINGDGTV